MGVPDEAEQLLLHLISNALRACDAGGGVWVSLKQKKTGVVLRVEDNGCGLMEEDPIGPQPLSSSAAQSWVSASVSSSAAVQAGS